jgi:hypothetical protein
MQNSLANPLVGTWRVIAFDDRQDEASPWQPLLGEHPVGYLVYDPTGRMSIQIMKTPPPPPFTTERVWTESPEEAKIALDGYVAYFGTYSVDQAKRVVTHHVEASLTPNIIGTDQARPFSIQGDRLVLGDGRTWRRVFERAG